MSGDIVVKGTKHMGGFIFFSYHVCKVKVKLQFFKNKKIVDEHKVHCSFAFH